MKLSDEELRFLSKIEKDEKDHQKGKWAHLFILSFLLVTIVFLWNIVQHGIANYGIYYGVPMLVLSYPPLLLFAAFMPYVLVKLVRNWNGNPERKLLIALAKRLSEEV